MAVCLTLLFVICPLFLNWGEFFRVLETDQKVVLKMVLTQVRFFFPLGLITFII